MHNCPICGAKSSFGVGQCFMSGIKSTVCKIWCWIFDHDWKLGYREVTHDLILVCKCCGETELPCRQYPTIEEIKQGYTCRCPWCSGTLHECAFCGGSHHILRQEHLHRMLE